MVIREPLTRSFVFMSFMSAALSCLLQGPWATPTPQPEAPVITSAAVRLGLYKAFVAPWQMVPDLAIAAGSLSLDQPSLPLIGTWGAALKPVMPLSGDYLLVSLGDRQVQVYQGGKLNATFPVAVGQAGWETPTGFFRIDNLEINPLWQHPITGDIVDSGPDNPLGSRWIGFWSDGEYDIGFHGTNQADSIGQAVSHGCLRMQDRDIQTLYAMVSPGMRVVVRP